MYGCGKSDDLILPAKLSNNALVAVGVAEMVEGRGSAKWNTSSKTRPGLCVGLSVSSALDGVRQKASRPWPPSRFCRQYMRQEPSALAAHAGICAGGRSSG